MKRYIDLFTQQTTQNEYVLYLGKAKKVGIILFFVLFGITILEAGVYFFLIRQIAEKESVTKRYNSFIIQNQVFDSKINYFAFKYGLLKQYLLQDADVTFYYGLLRTFLSETNSSAKIADFSLNNEQFVQFSLSFTTYDQAVDFMSQIESEKLPDYFDSLKLKEFTISSKETDAYILQFEGTFKKVTNAAKT